MKRQIQNQVKLKKLKKHQWWQNLPLLNNHQLQLKRAKTNPKINHLQITKQFYAPIMKEMGTADMVTSATLHTGRRNWSTCVTFITIMTMTKTYRKTNWRKNIMRNIMIKKSMSMEKRITTLITNLDLKTPNLIFASTLYTKQKCAGIWKWKVFVNFQVAPTPMTRRNWGRSQMVIHW